MLPAQRDFFDFDPHDHHRTRGMDTSEAAAYSVEHDARALMMQIFTRLRLAGPAAQCELAAALHLRPDQVWRRLSDLKNQGLIEDTGLRRLGPTKRFQAVWKVREVKQ